jgi:hypothetical protein
MLFLSRVWFCLWLTKGGRRLFLVGCACCIRQQFTHALDSEERQIIRQHIKLSSAAEYLNTSLKAQLHCCGTWTREPSSLTHAEHFLFTDSRPVSCALIYVSAYGTRVFVSYISINWPVLTADVVSDRTNHRNCSILSITKITATTATGNNSNNNSTDTGVRKYKKIRLSQKEKLVNAS